MSHSHLQLVGTSADPAPRPDLAVVGRTSSHTVQFYERDAYLATTVADFIADGLAIGQPCVVIATEEHRNAFAECLKERRLDGASAAGLLTMLDASETLERFMDGERPNAERFTSVIGGVLGASRRSSAHETVRAFGEMVELLWRRGNPQGALELERLWNDLGKEQSFALLCAYSMENFGDARHGGLFADICREHGHSLPTESYSDRDESARLLEITLLQQRARSLESELSHRQELEQQLRAALADAEAANKAKNQFLAVMSHELRTPLNAIAGHLALIDLGIHGPVSEAQRGALERIQRSQQHLLGLINDLMNLSKVEAGEVRYSFTDFDVTLLLTGVAELMEPLFTAKGIRCEVQRASHGRQSLIMHSDRDRVEQILLNLLMNAVKYTPEGSRVRLTAGVRSGKPPQVAITVTDNGSGIEPDKLETIFEPFVQLGTRRSSQEGVGLGLAISRDLARGMGGDLTATSTVGVGSAFTLTLPRAQVR